MQENLLRWLLDWAIFCWFVLVWFCCAAKGAVGGRWSTTFCGYAQHLSIAYWSLPLGQNLTNMNALGHHSAVREAPQGMNTLVRSVWMLRRLRVMSCEWFAAPSLCQSLYSWSSEHSQEPVCCIWSCGVLLCGCEVCTGVQVAPEQLGCAQTCQKGCSGT